MYIGEFLNTLTGYFGRHWFLQWGVGALSPTLCGEANSHKPPNIIRLRLFYALSHQGQLTSIRSTKQIQQCLQFPLNKIHQVLLDQRPSQSAKSHRCFLIKNFIRISVLSAMPEVPPSCALLPVSATDRTMGAEQRNEYDGI